MGWALRSRSLGVYGGCERDGYADKTWYTLSLLSRFHISPARKGKRIGPKKKDHKCRKLPSNLTRSPTVILAHKVHKPQTWNRQPLLINTLKNANATISETSRKSFLPQRNNGPRGGHEIAPMERNVSSKACAVPRDRKRLDNVHDKRGKKERVARVIRSIFCPISSSFPSLSRARMQTHKTCIPPAAAQEPDSESISFAMPSLLSSSEVASP